MQVLTFGGFGPLSRLSGAGEHVRGVLPRGWQLKGRLSGRLSGHLCRHLCGVLSGCLSGHLSGRIAESFAQDAAFLADNQKFLAYR